MDITELKAIKSALKFGNCIVTDTDLETLANLALKRVGLTYSPTYFTSFVSELEGQTYKIFDPEDAITSGCCADAVTIKDVYYNPHGDISNDIFNPQWPIYQEMFRQNSIFNRPADLIIYRQRLNTWRNTFGEQGWEIIGGSIGKPDTILKLHPAPKASGVTVYIEYTKAKIMGSLDANDEESFLLWLDYYVSDAMANYYSMSAGTSILGFATGTDALKYWERRAEKKHNQALTKTHGLHGEVDRTD